MTGKRGKGKGQGPARGPEPRGEKQPPFDATTGRAAALRRAALYEMTRDGRGRWTGLRPRSVAPRARSGDNDNG